jgi:hypothetical protein
MHKHAKNCWGGEIVSKAWETKNDLTINKVRRSLSKAKIQDGTITAMFERKGKESVTFLMKQHTYLETRSENTNITHHFFIAVLKLLDGCQRVCEA